MDQKSPWRILAYFVLIVVCFGGLYLTDHFMRQYYSPSDQELQHLAASQSSNADHLHTASLSVDEPEVAEEQAVVYLEKLADHYQAEVLNKLPANQSRKAITLYAYRHPADSSYMKALQQLKLAVREPAGNKPAGKHPVNVMLYGDSVSLTHLQLVAYTLLKEGLPLKAVTPTQPGTFPPPHAIQITTDTTLLSSPTLTFAEVQNISPTTAPVSFQAEE